MRYMMLVRSAGNAGSAPKAFNEAMANLSEGSTESGQLIAGGMLGDPALGARVRLRDGKVTVTDGPFSEAKEVIGGFDPVDLLRFGEVSVQCFEFSPRPVFVLRALDGSHGR